MFRKKGGNSEMAALRQKQIDGIAAQNPLARPIHSDRTVWDVPVKTQFGQLKYRVILHPDFPEGPPEMKLLVVAMHPWVVQPSLQIFGHPKLVNWNPQTNLGLLINEICTEFALHPPVPKGAQGPPQPARPLSQPQGGPSPVPQQQQQGQQMLQQPLPQHRAGNVLLPAAGNASPSPVPVNNRPQSDPPALPHRPSADSRRDEDADKPRKTPMPNIPEKFEQLDAYSTAQLEQLLNTPEKQEEFIETLDTVLNLIAVRDQLYDGIEDVARRNLQMKTEVDELKVEVENARRSVNERKEQYDALYARQQKVMKSYTTKALLDALKEAASQSASASDDLVRQYAKGEIQHNDFVQKYKDLRTQYHLRCAKEERLAAKAVR